MIPFWKMSASGNDFVVIDHRDRRLAGREAAFARRVCPRRTAVGADGVLLLEEAEDADFRMRTINADGSEAEMCGNGGRCIALYARENGIAGERMTFATLAGEISAEVTPAGVSLGMSRPGQMGETAIELSAGFVATHSIDTGVPHAIVFVDEIDDIDVVTVGRAIRRHEVFAPAGTNVDFVHWDGATATIRTYERGVEDETLACGTGATASALVCAALHGAASPVPVRTRGGDLTIYFTRTADGFDDVRLEGDARRIYRGELAEEQT